MIVYLIHFISLHINNSKEEKMNDSFVLRVGQVSGRDHIFSKINCQDAYASLQIKLGDGVYNIGVISDGCSEGKNSEVGAKLACSFSVSNISRLLEQKVYLGKIPFLLFKNQITFLRRVINQYKFSSYPDRLEFIKNHLLFTQIGFIQGYENTIVFAYGDGLVTVNNNVDFRDQGEAPYYPAYHLIDKRLLSDASEIPESFDSFVVKTKDIQKLAIGTDAWRAEKDLILSGYIWENQHESALQRKMNVWSTRQRRFQDDATLITLERIQEGEN